MQSRLRSSATEGAWVGGRSVLEVVVREDSYERLTFLPADDLPAVVASFVADQKLRPCFEEPLLERLHAMIAGSIQRDRVDVIDLL